MKPRFTKLSADGRKLEESAAEWVEVLDNPTGLIWDAHESDRGDEAANLAYIEKLNAERGREYRLPTLSELFNLADHGRNDPALDTDYFPNVRSSWYRTSTTAAGSPKHYVWFVSFYDGVAQWSYRDTSRGFVRAVRDEEAKRDSL